MLVRHRLKADRLYSSFNKKGRREFVQYLKTQEVGVDVKESEWAGSSLPLCPRENIGVPAGSWACNSM
jgi:hypothetical protein